MPKVGEQSTPIDRMKVHAIANRGASQGVFRFDKSASTRPAIGINVSGIAASIPPSRIRSPAAMPDSR